MKDYVIAFVFDKKQNVALIQKNRPKWEEGLLNGIGGKIEPGETPLEAIEREFLEETGYHIKEEKWIHTITMASTQNDAMVYIFKAYPINLKRLKTTTDEEVIICDINSLPDNIIPNIKWMIFLSLSSNEMPIQIINRDPFDRL